MKSMTGFGRAKLEKQTREYLVEIRSVNHKYADITVKTPRNLLYLEDKVRKMVLSRVARGKIEIFISYSNYGIEGKNVVFNKELAKEYIEQLVELAEETNLSKEICLSEIARMPDIFNVQIQEDSLELIWSELSECLENALDNFIEMRSIEGLRIEQDLLKRLQKIEENVEKISLASTGLVQEYVVKLEERIKEILKTDVVDQTRLAQEVVIYTDKSSIEEELTRLKSHTKQLEDLLKVDIPSGKKIDFLVQEMNREINTIGSKSASLEITNLVVELKTELEDIREQIQNIE